MKFSLWLVPVLIAFSGAPQAAENRWVVTDAQSFDAAAAQVRTQLASGRYAQLPSDEKKSIDADMTRMHALLTRYGPLRSLNRANGVRYFNLQEHVDGLLFGDLAQRQHCNYFRGDNVVTCATYAHLRAQGAATSLGPVPANTAWTGQELTQTMPPNPQGSQAGR